jgi:2-C-methyl-D-erythritol 2,4-cyclodiphosphate synthase
MEHYGIPPRLVESRGNNIKITRPGDLESAMSFLGGSSVALLPRIGSGYDVHAFEPGDSVVLGGVKIAHTHRLKAHSDGDVVLHAVMDALLGALALGDIGKHFPDTDTKWEGANSRSLLKAVMVLLSDRSYQVGNIDITVIAERPKLAPHISAIQSCIAEDLDVNASQVSVKATTTEKLGFTGRQEGIACQASVMLFPLGAE